MKINMVYITAGNKDEAEFIGKTLVSSGLAACVNILPDMNSIYQWNGKIQNDAELVVIAKTLESKVPDLIEKIKSIHSYECPCILSLPVSDGNTAFMEWIADNVRKS